MLVASSSMRPRIFFGNFANGSISMRNLPPFHSWDQMPATRPSIKTTGEIQPWFR